MVNTSGFICYLSRARAYCGYSGDGGPATSAKLYNPYSVFVDSHNIVYIADTYNHVVRKVSGGIITTIAGDGRGGFRGDGGLATAAELYYPRSGDRRRRRQLVHRRLLQLPHPGSRRGHRHDRDRGGRRLCGFSGDGPATENPLYYPTGVIADANGNLFIADTSNQRLRWVSPAGVMTTFAGTPGTAGFAGDGGPATAAQFYYPDRHFEDAAGNFLVADQYNQRVRDFTPSRHWALPPGV